MTEQIEKLVNYTNNRLKNWYKLVKEDYGVIGSAKATYSIEHDAITITAIEAIKPQSCIYLLTN